MIEILIGVCSGVIIFEVYEIITRESIKKMNRETREIAREADKRIKKLECTHSMHLWRITPYGGLESVCLDCGKTQCERPAEGMKKMFDEIKGDTRLQRYKLYKAAQKYFSEEGE